MRGGDIDGGKHAIVTGGSSGIGLATAKLLAARGMNVSILARNIERLADAREAAIRRATAELGAPRLLVASAGIAAAGYFLDMQAVEFERTMAVNYFGTIDAVRAVVPDM